MTESTTRPVSPENEPPGVPRIWGRGLVSPTTKQRPSISKISRRRPKYVYAHIHAILANTARDMPNNMRPSPASSQMQPSIHIHDGRSSDSLKRPAIALNQRPRIRITNTKIPSRRVSKSWIVGGKHHKPHFKRIGAKAPRQVPQRVGQGMPCPVCPQAERPAPATEIGRFPCPQTTCPPAATTCQAPEAEAATGASSPAAQYCVCGSVNAAATAVST